MKTVICSLPHASTNINGIQFESIDDGAAVAAVLEDDVAAQFEDIPGYQVINNEQPPEPPKAQKTKKQPAEVTEAETLNPDIGVDNGN